MSCPFCGSGNQAKFTAELLIHFSGLKNLDKPAVSVFPEFFGLLKLRRLSLYRSCEGIGVDSGGKLNRLLTKITPKRAASRLRKGRLVP
jgi:hypothetical protein